MKKFRIIVLTMLLFLPLTFIGCGKNKGALSTPNILEINGGTIVFNHIADAQYYTLTINGQEVVLDAHNSAYAKIEDNLVHYDASKIFVVGDSYSVKVQAHANKRPSSNFSTSVNYLHNGKTYTPENVKINSTILTWDSAENAHYYIVKMITPNDTAIYDKEGNVLQQDDPSSIAKANLTEYKFNTNQFDFSSLLKKAGQYKFYVCSAIGEGETRTLSAYSSRISYTHTVQLETPINSAVYTENNELYIQSVIDTNTNAITINCNGISHSLEFAGTEGVFEMLNANVVQINLNKFFASQIASNQIDFKDKTSFVFTTQSHNNTGILENNFYTASLMSKPCMYNENDTLNTPSISLEYNENNACYQAVWNGNSLNVGAYKLLVATPTQVNTYILDNNVFSYLLKEDFVAVAIQAVGAHSYKSSNMSNFIFKPNLTKSSSPTLTVNGEKFTWNNVGANYYVLTFGNEVYEIDGALTELITPVTALHENFNFHLTAIKDGYEYETTVLNKTLEEKLKTPTFSATQGFNSKNIYELTFTGDEKAFGYYVYIEKENDGYEQVNKLFTSTTIDLTQYITDEEGLSNYKVMVKSVAAPKSGYLSSEYSTPITVAHLQVLDSPEFFTVNGNITPVVKKYVDNELRYILKFTGVENAKSYSIFINHNHFSVTATENESAETVWEIDVTDYLKYANVYDISISAVPDENANNMRESEKSTTQYVVTKQLETVQNVKVTETDGVYILSFDTVNNAHEYQVRIVKENDGDYATYLSNLGLSHTFNVNFATDITKYVQQQGRYYFYVTALASTENGSFYSNANESNYATVSKLTSLKAPVITSIEGNNDNSNYILSWKGDEHADYYLIQTRSANGLETEFVKQISSNDNHENLSFDVKSIMNIEGNYSFTIFSMVNSMSDNAAVYTSSQGTTHNLSYSYNTIQDFKRSNIYMYGSSANYYIDNIIELKNLLWHHYLYEQNENGLSLMLNTIAHEDAINPVRNTIIALAEDAYKGNVRIYNFASDPTWQAYTAQDSSATNNDLFKYLCEKILLTYPEFNLLTWGTNAVQSNENVFNLQYKNELNHQKVANPDLAVLSNVSYTNDHKYIAQHLRKSATGSFAIDQKEEMVVTTTEQLLHAVVSNKKPRFVGNSIVAETVYQKAKLVLSAIVSNSMTDYEKTEAIFNWLANNYDLAYYNVTGQVKISGSVEKNRLDKYGLSDKYYLEGIFNAVNANGEVATRTSTTSFGYSKAFALLCRIEGIEAIVVNGSYNHALHGTILHSWNKVNIPTVSNSQKAWYAVDLTFSANYVNFNDFSKGYSTGSHTYFLKSSTKAKDPNSQHHLLGLNDDISNVVDLSHLTEQDIDCYTEYNYYANAKYSLTSAQIKQVVGSSSHKDISYFMNYVADTYYQQYFANLDGNLQNFILNGLVYSSYNAMQNENHKSVFEFSFDYLAYNNNSPSLSHANWNAVFNEFKSNCYTISKKGEAIYVDDQTHTSTMVFVIEYNE